MEKAKSKLQELQQRTRVRKNMYNAFSGFYYRSAEGILEEVKPILNEIGATIILYDELQALAGEVVVKSVADFCYENESVCVSSCAVVDLNKKGMDKAQATGAAVSYARKYALCGLLLLDDGQDSDSEFNEKNVEKELKKFSTLNELTAYFETLTTAQQNKVKPIFSARYNELKTKKNG